MEKHAYMIMAHHRGDLLARLVAALDHERNDLYIHLDVKCREPINIAAKRSRLVWLPRMDVRWGGYSQVRCEYALLERAVQSGERYAYYHLLTGASYPIKSNEYIFSFFEKHRGKEFVGFAKNEKRCCNRVRCKFLFSEMGRVKSKKDEKKMALRLWALRLQGRLGIDFFKRFRMEFRKGLAYWSITEDCARYLLSRRRLARKMLWGSLCGDEVFVQTLVYNSPFRERVYSMGSEYEGAAICVAWKECVGGDRKNQNLCLADYRQFFQPGYLYALKFEGEDGHTLMSMIDRDLLLRDTRSAVNEP